MDDHETLYVARYVERAPAGDPLEDGGCRLIKLFPAAVSVHHALLLAANHTAPDVCAARDGLLVEARLRMSAAEGVHKGLRWARELDELVDALP